ncbi:MULTISPECIES: SDR family NAD(P)-dependent oxidoreductase [unclassified Rathayibacter]|jgi:NAD(P)-dependent dehydrogenase (short-subunit alcohol dehydrogenase family)|uniref:SDR family NAD(P)-dependent oxidoreductase n=1 Tax=unclassified Rathayibacter TaxID=2609250 RepID=UPI000CE8AB21|nr:MULTISPECIES: SDR family NAD(P)-dependent oxidoreductase [unclassified Rathayibacter]PPG50428.1 short-chain dehydrogenase [Rathayibacter sp. AY2B3]PPI24086.1 short-chain dehydrogenase [Rathayibacter sp. AY1B5]
MPLLTVIGAGPGLGLEIARVFGRAGFTVALVSRNQEKLDGLAARLAEEGIEATGFAADIARPETLTAALRAIRADLGPIDVLEFSPADSALAPVGVLDVTPENLQPQIDFYLGGALRAVGEVVPDMIAAGSGTILVTTGGGSVAPHAALANINIAAAGLRNWVLNLHSALEPRGVYAAHVAITALIDGGHPDAAAEVIARSYLDLHRSRDRAELHYVAWDA